MSRSVKHVGPAASSSGRVPSTSMTKGKARQVSNPYPIGDIFLGALFVNQWLTFCIDFAADPSNPFDNYSGTYDFDVNNYDYTYTTDGENL